MSATAKAKSAKKVSDVKGSGTDLRGAAQLSIAAVKGVVDLVESLHGTIATLSPIVGATRGDRTQGITGLVYRSIRGVTKVTGAAVDLVLEQLTPILNTHAATPIGPREAILAALNGVFGDFLAKANNPLAIPMQLRQKGRGINISRLELADAFPNPNGKLLIIIHGLCMNDLQWQRDGHDHGRELASRFDYTPLYLHYNSGLHVSINGQALSALLEDLLEQWPHPIDELVILGHSMGGLVARSACHYASRDQRSWPKQLKKLIFLGTPHHGAPLERAGSWLDFLLGVSPYSAPFARLGMARSDGIRDLRHGMLLEEDWQAHSSSTRADIRTPVPLPEGVDCYTIAATRQHPPKDPDGKHNPGVSDPGGTIPINSNKLARLPVRSDGLVPVSSALGHHPNATRALDFASTRQKIFFDMSHFDLLNRAEVFEQLCDWLGTKTPQTKPA